MRALVCEAYGPVENLKVADLAVPEPKAGEILVRVGAAGVSFACTYCGSMPGYQLNCLTIPSAWTSGLSARSMNFLASAGCAVASESSIRKAP